MAVETLLVVFVSAYLGGLITVGVIKSRRVKDEAAFVLAGRNLGLPILVGTLLATWTGTGSIISNAEQAYEKGMPAYLIPLSSVVGLLFLSVMATRVRGRGRFTLQDLLEERFGVVARVLGTLTLVAAYLIIVSYQLRAGAVLVDRLGEITGVTTAGVDTHTASLVLVALFIATYTALAGLMSVAITDAFNGVLMIVGLLVALPLIVVAAGGVDQLRAALPPAGQAVTGYYTAFDLTSILLPAFLLMLGDANLHQRFLSARSNRTAVTAALVLIPFILVVDGAILSLAMGGRVLLPDLASPAHVILELGLTQLPPVVGALLVATILAVIVSTADSFLLSSSSSLLRDVYQRFIHRGASERQLVLVARVLVVVMTAVALRLAFEQQGFFNVALLAYTIYGVGITPVLLAALFWKRATPAGAVASMLCAGATVLVWERNEFGPRAVALLGQPEGSRLDAVIPAILVAGLVLVGVSLVTRPRQAA